MDTINEMVLGANTRLKKLELALTQGLKGKNGVESDFKEAYPILERHLAQKVRKRTLMEQFNVAYAHGLNLVQFRKLLNAERERRRVFGDMATCSACGQLLVGTGRADGAEEA